MKKHFIRIIIAITIIISSADKNVYKAELPIPTSPTKGIIFDNYGNFRECILLEPSRDRPIIAILQTTFKDTEEAWDDLPQYLRYALEKHYRVEKKSHSYYPVMRYVRYRDLKRIIGMIYDDALLTGNGKAGAPEFMTELTGYSYEENAQNIIAPVFNADSVPIRKVRNSGKSRYEELFNMDSPEIEILVTSLEDGLYNIDPRVRLTVSAILEAIGPHPIMHDAYIAAMQIEMVGHVYNNAPFAQSNVSNTRHKYANINGCEEDDIPFRRFSLQDRKISRTKAVFYLEETKELTPEDFKTMSASMFNALADNLMFQPNFPLFYDNDYLPNDLFVPNEFYVKKKYVLEELRKTNLLPLTVDNVEALNPEIREAKMKEKAAGGSNNKGFWRVRESEMKNMVQLAEQSANSEQKEGLMDDFDFRRIVTLYLSGLDNPDFTVQKKSAFFLRKILTEREKELTDHLKMRIVYAIRDKGLGSFEPEEIPEIDPKNFHIITVRK